MNKMLGHFAILVIGIFLDLAYILDNFSLRIESTTGRGQVLKRIQMGPWSFCRPTRVGMDFQADTNYTKHLSGEGATATCPRPPWRQIMEESRVE